MYTYVCNYLAGFAPSENFLRRRYRSLAYSYYSYLICNRFQKFYTDSVSTLTAVGTWTWSLNFNLHGFAAFRSIIESLFIIYNNNFSEFQVRQREK